MARKTELPLLQLLTFSAMFHISIQGRKCKGYCSYIIWRRQQRTKLHSVQYIRGETSEQPFWLLDCWALFLYSIKSFHFGSQHRAAYLQQNFGSYRISLHAAVGVLFKGHCATATFQSCNRSKYTQFFICLFSSTQEGRECVFMTD